MAALSRGCKRSILIAGLEILADYDSSLTFLRQTVRKKFTSDLAFITGLDIPAEILREGKLVSDLFYA